MNTNVAILLSVKLLLITVLIFSIILFVSSGSDLSSAHHPKFINRSSLVNIDTKYNRGGSFSKIGLLRDNETGKMKPLLSRQVSPDRHQYFTSENHDGFLLNMPLFDHGGRSCTSGAGCSRFFDGDFARGIDGSKYQVISF